MIGVPLMLLFGPRLDSALIEREAWIGNHQVHVIVDGVAETLTAWARAHGIVEAEKSRLRSSQLDAALFACELMIRRTVPIASILFSVPIQLFSMAAMRILGGCRNCRNPSRRLRGIMRPTSAG